MLSEALTFILDLHRDDSLLEIFEVRRQLEPYAAALAASRIDDETLGVLDAALDSVDAVTSVDELTAHDLEFHRTVSGRAATPTSSACWTRSAVRRCGPGSGAATLRTT